MKEARAAVELSGFQGTAPQLPFDLGSGVALVSAPQWRNDNGVTKGLTVGKSGIVMQPPYALSCEVSDALAFGEARFAFESALIAIWIARPNGMCMGDLFIKSKGDSMVSTATGLWHESRMIPHDSYKVQALCNADFSQAKRLLPNLTVLAEGGNVRNVAWLLCQALYSRQFVPRFVLLCIALEALYAPNDGREITYRLAQRGAFFLGGTPADRQQINRELVKIYNLRSKVVHGLRTSKLSPGQQLDYQLRAELLVRRSLEKVLLDPEVAKVFDSKGRECYLDDLVFS